MAEYVELSVNNYGEVAAASRALRGSTVISYDIETQGLDALTHRTLLWGFRGEETPNYVTAEADVAYQLLVDCGDKVWLAHNAAFEIMFTQVAFKYYPAKWFDTMLAEQLLTAGLLDVRHDLAGVIRRYCGNVHGGKDLQTSFVGENPDTFKATHEQLSYLADDVAFLHDVMYAQSQKLRDEGLLRAARIEMRVLPAFAEMQLRGMYLSRARHKPKVEDYKKQETGARVALEEALEPLWQAHLATENTERAKQYQEEHGHLTRIMAHQGIQRLAKDTPDDIRALVLEGRKARDKWKPKKVEPINVASADQVLAALAVADIHPKGPDKKGKVRPTLDKNVLREMQNFPLIRLYSAWAVPAKAVSTYGEGMWERISPKTGRFHAGYRQCGAASGRTSTSPQIQNIPPDIRACFEAEEGNVLIVADAKNQEGRLAAALSGDETLLGVFRDGVDWHSLTAAAAWPSLFPDWKSVPKDDKNPLSAYRARAKNGNFSSIYGGTGRTLFSRGYVDDLETGDKIMRAIADTYPTLADFSQKAANSAVSHGWVATISGRKRYFSLGEQPRGDSEALSEWKRRRGGIRRSAMNHPVQGSGADVMKQAMIFLLPRLKEYGFMFVAMVHDELVFEGPQARAEEVKAIVLDSFERAATCFTDVLPIPAEAVITSSWRK